MRKTKLNYKPYPEYDDIRSGCKVGWRYYKDRAKAEACAEAAKHNAQIDAGLGYDFGYCSPGSITEVKQGERAGMWEVCVS